MLVEYEGITYKAVILKPEDYRYNDRGMMKWQGMILTDHTEALKKLKNEELEEEPLPKGEQTKEEISKILLHAYKKQRPISIQANILKQKNGNYYRDIKAHVMGQLENEVYFKTKKGQVFHTTLEHIRHVELYDPLKWNGKIK